MNRGLYLHFPFCEKKCYYCDFYSVANSDMLSRYIDALCREIIALSDKSISFDTVYLGGGTPSLIPLDSLEKLLGLIFSHLKIQNGAEITIEANPLSAGKLESIRSWKSFGINRLSIGVQSFCDAELSAIGRGHDASSAIKTLEMAKAQGFDSVSADLMFALPHQNMTSLMKSIDTSLSLGVEHLSLYALTIEEKTVFGVRRKKGEDLFLPDEDTELEMYLSSCQRLLDAGFEHYEISNFAKSGCRSRHNMKYWKGEEYIGIGASAHSYYQGERYSMPDSISKFCEKSEKLTYAVNSKSDKAEEFVMLSLRLSDGLDLKRLDTDFGYHTSDDFYTLAYALEKNGLCKTEGSRLKLTDKGFFISNSIILKILESLKITS